MKAKHQIVVSISVTALALLGGAGAHAETYDGVHAVTSATSRADVKTEAVAATRAGDSYSDVASGGVATVDSVLDRVAVREQAVAAAHNPLQSLDRRAFYRDEVPAAYKKPGISFTRQTASR
ncbi:alpha/beta hydrolase [Variovorax sp.]|jgi:hypothetical protein|uniref:alpha/beta hydrolase n=1 Tax=Variovorax sp. TaxID=1871043 RepID=UPI0037DA28EB